MKIAPHTKSLPHSHVEHWLLAYDIRNPKRLQAICRCLSKEGVRLQYSVYLLTANRQQIERLIERLRLIIDERADDVRVYPIGENARIWGLGAQFYDDGNTLSDDFVGRMLRATQADAAVGPIGPKHSFELW